MKLKTPQPHKKARVEIIPLIDVIFFLLATFVLVSLSMTSQPGVRVYLPESETSQPHELGETITVTMTDKNVLYWDKETVGFDMYCLKLEAYKQKCVATNVIPRILFNADSRADFAQCATLLDEIRKAGIQKVSIETRVKTNHK
jgi:biopolymer transport protein ExbD